MALVKKWHAHRTAGNDLFSFYGEDIYARHACEYGPVTEDETFRLFAVSTNGRQPRVLHWTDTTLMAAAREMPVVPVLTSPLLMSCKHEMETWLDSLMRSHRPCGEREGLACALPTASRLPMQASTCSRSCGPATCSLMQSTGANTGSHAKSFGRESHETTNCGYIEVPKAVRLVYQIESIGHVDFERTTNGIMATLLLITDDIHDSMKQLKFTITEAQFNDAWDNMDSWRGEPEQVIRRLLDGGARLWSPQLNIELIWQGEGKP